MSRSVLIASQLLQATAAASAYVAMEMIRHDAVRAVLSIGLHDAPEKVIKLLELINKTELKHRCSWICHQT